MALLVYGPVLPYSHVSRKRVGEIEWQKYMHSSEHAAYEANRKRVAALERQLWIAAKAARNTMLNGEPSFDHEFDESLWMDIHKAFASHLNLSN